MDACVPTVESLAGADCRIDCLSRKVFCNRDYRNHVQYSRAKLVVPATAVSIAFWVSEGLAADVSLHSMLQQLEDGIEHRFEEKLAEETAEAANEEVGAVSRALMHVLLRTTFLATALRHTRLILF